MQRFIRLVALCGLTCAQLLPTLRAESPEIEALKNDLADCRADRKKGIKRNCHWFQQEIKKSTQNIEMCRFLTSDLQIVQYETNFEMR